MGNDFTVVAAIPENVVGLGLLEILAADLAAGNLRGDRQHGHTIPLAIVEAIDEVRVPRPATAGTDRQIARQVRLSPGRKRALLLHCVYVSKRPTRVLESHP